MAPVTIPNLQLPRTAALPGERPDRPTQTASPSVALQSKEQYTKRDASKPNGELLTLTQAATGPGDMEEQRDGLLEARRGIAEA